MGLELLPPHPAGDDDQCRPYPRAPLDPRAADLRELEPLAGFRRQAEKERTNWGRKVKGKQDMGKELTLIFCQEKSLSDSLEKACIISSYKLADLLYLHIIQFYRCSPPEYFHLPLPPFLLPSLLPFLHARVARVFSVLMSWCMGLGARGHLRRLIDLISAGRNRIVMIRRELPRTEYAGWVLEPFRTEAEEGSPFRGPCAVIGSAVQSGIEFFSQAALTGLCCFSVSTAMAQMKPSNSRPIAVTIWFLFLPRAAMAW